MTEIDMAAGSTGTDAQHVATYANFLVLVQAAALHLALTFAGLLVALVWDHKAWGFVMIGVGTIGIALWAIGRLRPQGL
jgi:hypothetical protein